MSARSSARPSRHITYASSWVIAVASTPSSRRLSAITRVRNRSRTRRSTPRSILVDTYRYRSFSVIQPSRGTVSRVVRRFSLDALTHDATLPGLRGSVTRNVATAFSVRSPIDWNCIDWPTTAASGSHWVTPGRSALSSLWARTMRAVSSARSM